MRDNILGAKAILDMHLAESLRAVCFIFEGTARPPLHQTGVLGERKLRQRPPQRYLAFFYRLVPTGT